jgi:hypothetical protein
MLQDWIQLDKRFTREEALYALGFIPSWLSVHDERSAAEQLNAGYAHGGGWQPFGGGLWKFDREHAMLSYPDDPPMKAICAARLRNETIWVFPAAWVLIEQDNGEFEVSRMN